MEYGFRFQLMITLELIILLPFSCHFKPRKCNLHGKLDVDEGPLLDTELGMLAVARLLVTPINEILGAPICKKLMKNDNFTMI